jgi:hypothetical protein
MPEEKTTAIVQRYLDALTGEAPPEPIVRLLPDRAFLRLHPWRRIVAALRPRGHGSSGGRRPR